MTRRRVVARPRSFRPGAGLSAEQIGLPRLLTHTFDWCSVGRPLSQHALCCGWYVSGGMLVVCACRECHHRPRAEEVD